MKTLYKVTLKELQELRRANILKGVDLIAKIQDRKERENLKRWDL